MQSALASGLTGSVEATAQLDQMQKDLGPLITGILAALLAGGKSAADERGGSFSALDGSVQRAVQRQVGLAVERIVSGSRSALKQAIQRIFSNEIDPEIGAREIRNAIGLTAPMERSLAIQRVAMEQAEAKQSVIERSLETRAKRLSQYRAMVVADTEAYAAISAGRKLYWDQLQAEGEIPSNAQRKWKTAADEKVCPICRPMDGQIRGLNEFFKTGDGTLIATAPAHITCRCFEILVE